MKRLNFFQKELSLNLDLGVFDGSSRDKIKGYVDISTVFTIPHICF